MQKPDVSTFEIAEAVAAALNGMELPLVADARAQVEAAPDYDLPELAKMKIPVVPSSLELGARDRVNMENTVKIDIGIFKRIKSEDEIRELVKLEERIAGAFYRRRLVEIPAAMCIGAAVDPLYDSDLLRERRQFTGVIRLEFEL